MQERNCQSVVTLGYADNKNFFLIACAFFHYNRVVSFKTILKQTLRKSSCTADSPSEHLKQYGFHHTYFSKISC